MLTFATKETNESTTMNIPSSMKSKGGIATLATLGVTLVAATATTVFKIRQKRRQRREQTDDDSAVRLSAEQQMVYNEAVSRFIRLNDRLNDWQVGPEKDVQTLLCRLALQSPLPVELGDEQPLASLAADIERFIREQVPFINACLSAIGSETATYADCVRYPLGEPFDSRLDETADGSSADAGAIISSVQRLGYYFPECNVALHPVKCVVRMENFSK